MQYRSNLGISAFTTGNINGIIAFAVFAALILIINLGLSVRTYRIRRELSVAVLAAGVLLLVLSIIVSNTLMVLH